MIIDAHQHYWDGNKFFYSWLTPEVGVCYRNFVPEDLKGQLAESGVKYTVAVQARSEVAETEWLLDMADENEFLAGIVGWVDLQSDEIDKTLDELVKRPKFVGVRHQVEDEKNREWILQESVINGLKSVAAHGLAYDALMKHDQLWQLEKVCKECPNLRIVIDHCSKPNIKDDEFDEWAEHLRAAAKLPVYCKISGLLTEAGADTWTVEKVKKYTDFIIEIFGADRLMIGSDWPVSLPAASHCETINVIKELISDLPEEDQQKILYKNAAAFYKLNAKE